MLSRTLAVASRTARCSVEIGDARRFSSSWGRNCSVVTRGFREVRLFSGRDRRAAQNAPASLGKTFLSHGQFLEPPDRLGKFLASLLLLRHAVAQSPLPTRAAVA